MCAAGACLRTCARTCLFFFFSTYTFCSNTSFQQRLRAWPTIPQTHPHPPLKPAPSLPVDCTRPPRQNPRHAVHRDSDDAPTLCPRRSARGQARRRKAQRPQLQRRPGPAVSQRRASGDEVAAWWCWALWHLASSVSSVWSWRGARSPTAQRGSRGSVNTVGTAWLSLFCIYHHHHHHHHHRHESLNHEGRWGTTDDFTTSFLHFSLFSTALWDCQTPGLSTPWCWPTSSSVCLVFFPLSLCLARWLWPDLMNGKHDHTTSGWLKPLTTGPDDTPPFTRASRCVRPTGQPQQSNKDRLWKPEPVTVYQTLQPSPVPACQRQPSKHGLAVSAIYEPTDRSSLNSPWVTEVVLVTFQQMNTASPLFRLLW